VTGRRLLVWRHGQTEWNASGRAQGQTEVPLDDAGRAQAREAAARLASLRPVALWSSDLSRASETAQALADVTGLRVRLDARLREAHLGVRQGLTIAESRAQYPDEWARWDAGEQVRFPKAEIEHEVADRIRTVMRDAARELLPEQLAVLVSHGVAMRLGICRFLDLPQANWKSFSGFSNCAWALLEEGQRGWRLMEYNAGSLPEPLLSDDLVDSDSETQARVDSPIDSGVDSYKSPPTAPVSQTRTPSSST
jgi:broad specificity phosphatase PhoE